MKINKITFFFLLLVTTNAVSQPLHTPHMPDYNESGRVLTLNKMGWMHPIIDPITEKFLEQCKKDLKVLEIGASYGYASEEALKKGALVWINDLDIRHLEIFKYNIEDTALLKRVSLVPGDFPEKVTLENEFFDSILAVRVLHFFSPKKLELSAKKMFQSLKKGGYVYIVAETPYLKNWSGYIPVYEKKKLQGDPYPGYFTNLKDYNQEVSKYLPKSLHFLDPEVLTLVFTKAGFIVKEAVFLNRKDYPKTMQLDGRESVGFIAYKP